MIFCLAVIATTHSRTVFDGPLCGVSFGDSLCVDSRFSFSSRPTVETRYPRAQKLSSVKFLGFSINVRAIALFPVRYPTMCDTEYLGGIDTRVAQQVPCVDSTLTLHRQLL